MTRSVRGSASHCLVHYAGGGLYWVLATLAGSAPYQGEPPMKVMLKVLQGPPPSLQSGSKQLRELVAACLNKEPSARPTAKKLLSLKALSTLKVTCPARKSSCERTLQSATLSLT